MIRGTPKGVLEWLTQEAPSAERAILELLLKEEFFSPLEMSRLVTALGRPSAEIARALFNLNRQRSMRVEDQPAAALPDEELSLEELLHSITAKRGCAVLADETGRCLALHGWDAADAERVARLASHSGASSPLCVRFHMDWGMVTLASNVSLDRESQAWVHLARRLLRMQGAPIGGNES